jgi:hypothetical protein
MLLCVAQLDSIQTLSYPRSDIQCPTRGRESGIVENNKSIKYIIEICAVVSLSLCGRGGELWWPDGDRCRLSSTPRSHSYIAKLYKVVELPCICTPSSFHQRQQLRVPLRLFLLFLFISPLDFKERNFTTSKRKRVSTLTITNNNRGDRMIDTNSSICHNN